MPVPITRPGNTEAARPSSRAPRNPSDFKLDSLSLEKVVSAALLCLKGMSFFCTCDMADKTIRRILFSEILSAIIPCVTDKFFLVALLSVLFLFLLFH